MGKYLEIKGVNFETQRIERVNFYNEFDIILSSYPTNGGKCYGEGSYQEGSSVEISAVPHPLFEFQKWSDDDINNPRTILLNSDTILTGIFAYTSLDVTITDYSPYTITPNLVLDTGRSQIKQYNYFLVGYIPIVGGCTIEIPFVDNRDSVVAITKDNPSVPNAYIHYATGESFIRLSEVGEKLIKVAPDDANYLYFTVNVNTTQESVAPSYIKISL